MKLIFLILILIIQTQQQGNLDVKGNLVIKNGIGGKYLDSQAIRAQQIVSKSNLQTDTLIVDKLKADNIILDEFVALDPKEKFIMEIDCDIVVSGISAKESMNFVNLIEDNSQQKDWALVHHDNFQDEKSLSGWNLKQRNYCGNEENNIDAAEYYKDSINEFKRKITQNNFDNIKNKKNIDYFLGGHCLTSNLNLIKTYENLKFHKSIKINAQVHLFDNWQGEEVFLMVDNQKVWSKQSSVQQQQKGLDICGGSSPDQAFAIPIDISIPHENKNITLNFGSTLEKHACEASFAIDNIMIYLK